MPFVMSKQKRQTRGERLYKYYLKNVATYARAHFIIIDKIVLTSRKHMIPTLAQSGPHIKVILKTNASHDNVASHTRSAIEAMLRYCW